MNFLGFVLVDREIYGGELEMLIIFYMEIFHQYILKV
jgi:hypothetical protein